MRKISILAMIIALCLCACGDTSEVNNTEKTVETAEVETLEEETNSEAQPVKETQEEVVDEEDVTEVAEEVVESPQTIAQWAKSLDKTEPRLTIWNDDTKEGYVLENGNMYTVKENDQVVICYEGEETNFVSKAYILKPKKMTTSYRIIEILEMPTKPTQVELAQTVDGIEYVYQVTLISEEAAASFDGDLSEWVPGKEWALSLEFDAPKLLAWNDELNTKVVIDEGTEYQMQTGDCLALYTPEDFFGYSSLNPEGFVEEIFLQSWHIQGIKYNLPQNNQPINFKIDATTFDHTENINDFTFTCTLIPPTE